MTDIFFIHRTEKATQPLNYGSSTASIGCDNDGLLTAAGRFAITRNTENGLPEMVSADSFQMNRTFNGEERNFWLNQTTLLAVFDGFGNIRQRFEYADDRVPYAMTQGGTTYYLAYGQVGSLRLITDNVGTTVKRVDYDSFGNIISDSNPAFVIPFGFAGGLHDRDTNLVRFGYRDYMPEIGKWTAKDPILFAGGDSNLYGYVSNDPVNWVDPWGLYFGQYPPPPPGYNPSTWTTGQWDNGNWALTDPNDNTYTAHPEDDGHWRHWDKQDPQGKDDGRWPPNSKKPRPNQKKPKNDQCTSDPNGNEPGWTPPDGTNPFMPLYPGDVPLNAPGRMPIRVPIRIPMPVW